MLLPTCLLDCGRDVLGRYVSFAKLAFIHVGLIPEVSKQLLFLLLKHLPNLRYKVTLNFTFRPAPENT
jgi:hypothetical protein